MDGREEETEGGTDGGSLGAGMKRDGEGRTMDGRMEARVD